eukprot:CAMPEP_0201590828 /NCGR_PEP_ID=MMETSP0190_2-20130828/182202_1 /ASSEMBLY_ACC=CAM_ASM_000263 /TAXON_ID=37353 /ORGANISM="Rosalina sp." /LENGTH=80 /DNA_ID=CAMNT_0048047745 /DNA_START=677 /DNA_END=919 /DNA_ORIENTATION=-
MSRTPRAKRSNNTNNTDNSNENDKSKLDFDEYEDDIRDMNGTEVVETNNEENIVDVDISMTMEIDNGYHQGVRMQLCFDD